ncbi:MAG: rhodanese-like domain-containing protein [Hyphomicrobium sp.]
MVEGGNVHIEDVSPTETWSRLEADPKAVLVDVRTRAEWAFVGLPDLKDLGRQVLAVEWQTFPDNRTDPQFADRLAAALTAQGVTQSDEIFFICRSGGRSRMAAEAIATVGYGRCRNVADGFEGPLDNQRHRGQVAGWKFDGLPWIQG